LARPLEQLQREAQNRADPIFKEVNDIFQSQQGSDGGPILGRPENLPRTPNSKGPRFLATAAATLPSPRSRCRPHVGEEAAATVAVCAWEKRSPPPSSSAPGRRGRPHRLRLGEEAVVTLAVRVWEKSTGVLICSYGLRKIL
jgi:hypothetical protein